MSSSMNRFGRHRTRVILGVIAGTLLVLGCCALFIPQPFSQWFVINGVQHLGGSIWFADERTEDGYSKPVTPPPQLTWKQRLFGEGAGRAVHGLDFAEADDVSDELLRHISRLPELKFLTISPVVARRPEFQRIRESHPDLDLHIRWSLRHAPVETVASVDGFNEVLKAERVVLFIDGDWSTAAAQSRSVFCQLAHTWSETTPSLPVRFVRLDFTASETPLWHAVQEWMNGQSIPPGGYKGYGGVGKVIWVSAGSALDYAWTVAEEENGAVIERTRKAFGDK